jgi:hypothetical protein
MSNPDEYLLDHFENPREASGTRTVWRCFTDTVMGGLSSARAEHGVVMGRPALRLRGQVSLENNGGFVQIALDLAPGGGTFDASAYAGLAVELTGDGRAYKVHLRTTDCTLPWQSYRATVSTSSSWTSVSIPFSQFAAHRVSAGLDLTRLRRIGLVAIGEAGDVDVAISRLALYTHSP